MKQFAACLFHLGVLGGELVVNLAIHLVAILVAPFIAVMIMPITPVPWKFCQCILALFLHCFGFNNLAKRFINAPLPFPVLENEWQRHQASRLVP